MTDYIEICSEFLNQCFQVANEFSGSIASVAPTGMALYHSYTYDFKMLIQEIDNASYLLSNFNRLIVNLDTLQNQYNLSICSLDKAESFSRQMYEFLKNTAKDSNGIITKINERAYAKWYRDELKFYVEYLVNFTQFLISDINYIYKQIESGNVIAARELLKCRENLFFQ